MKFIQIPLIILLFYSCQTLDVFEKTDNIEKQAWNSLQSKQFSFNVTDTTTYQNFYLVLRHSNQYPYKNLWLEIDVKSPDDTLTFKKEFTLADNSKWLGNSINEIVEHRIAFNPQPIQLKKGMHTFTLKQIMREDPLPFIYAVGVRVQKINK